MPKCPNDTLSKKPPAPSVKVRGAATPLEQRSGAKPLDPPAQRRAADEAKTGRRAKPVPVRGGRGQHPLRAASDEG
jgi:hypothetical protein